MAWYYLAMLTWIAPWALRMLFDKAFDWYFKNGGVTIGFPDGTERHYGPVSGGPTISFVSWRDLTRVAVNSSLGFGDAYTAGRITHNGHENLSGFLKVVAANRRNGRMGRALHRLRWRPPNGYRWQRHNIGEHYDGDGKAMAAWYRDVLGLTLLYTCARFETGTETLDKAQDAKVHNIGLKLGLKPQHDTPYDKRPYLLDIGCGWGYAACYLAREFGVRVLGITISREQLPVARQLAIDMGVDHLVEFQLISYQELGEQAAHDPKFERFDAAYSIGMLEHVPHSEYNQYFRIVRRLIKPRARFVLHCITNQLGGPPDPFVVKRIFPGSRLGSLAQIMKAAARSNFLFTDGENLWQHYVLTLRAWIQNHLAHREEIIQRSGAEFERQRYFWLAASEAAFEEGDLSLLQIVFVSGKPQFGTWPWSRAYLYLRGLAQADNL